MRILVLAQVVAYPPDAGPKVKTFEVLRHLARRHDLTFCAFARTEAEERNAIELRDLCHRVATVPLHRSRLRDVAFLVQSVATHESFLLRRDDRTAMHVMVRRLLRDERIDLLHVDQLNMMRFVPPDWHGTVVLDDHNAVWQMVEGLQHTSRNPFCRWLLKRETHIIRQVEGVACRRSHLVLTVSEQDQSALRRIAGGDATIEVVPIGVDMDRFRPINASRSPCSGRLLSIGTMFWPPNSDGVGWWLREGYEHLQALCPNVTYDIVGARPPRPLLRLARRYAGIRVHGYVADATPFWNSARALAVPLLCGGGVRVKILEAMAMGVPVVSTSRGADGLAVRHGEHVLLADTPTAFAEACAAVLCDPALAQQLVERAFRLVHDQYSAPIALQALDMAYARVAEREGVPCASRL